MAYPVVEELLDRFGTSLRFVFRHFPLTEVHPNAAPAAETAEFAGDHGLFWEMHDALYTYQSQLGLQLYSSLAARFGLPQDGLREALAYRLHADKIRADFMGGVHSGVNGTPCFFVNDVRHDGGFAFEELSRAIEAARNTVSGAAVHRGAWGAPPHH
jgi:protein-disulfide isomerase